MRAATLQSTMKSYSLLTLYSPLQTLLQTMLFVWDIDIVTGSRELINSRKLLKSDVNK